jgi:hypothetical protein
MQHRSSVARAPSPGIVLLRVLGRRRSGGTGRTLVGRRSGRTLLILWALRAVSLRARSLRARSLWSGTLLVGSLRTGTLRTRALLATHLRPSGLHLLVVLIALVVAQDAHDLPAQVAAGAGIARAARGMRLAILIDQRLDVLLLIRREIQVAESLRPMPLQVRYAGRRRVAGARRRLVLLRLLLCACDDRRHERRRQRGGSQEVYLHGLDTNRCRDAVPERRIRT